MLDGMGSGIEVAKYTEKLVPSTRFVAVDGVAPAVSGANNFVAPSASVIGKVSIGEHSRWVLRVQNLTFQRIDGMFQFFWALIL